MANSGKRKATYVLIAFVVGVLIKLFLPAANGLTPEGVTLLAVFIPTVILWVTNGTSWTTWLCLTAVSLVQLVNGVSTMNTMWGNSVNAVLIPMLLIVNVMTENGATQYIAEWVLSRKIVHGRPYVFYFLLCIAITILGTVVYPMILCVMFMELMVKISNSIGYTKEDKFYKASLLIILWMSTIMDAVWPFAKPTCTTIMTFMASIGYDINILMWMSVSVPFALVCALMSLVVIKVFYRPDVSKFVNYDDESIRTRLKETHINRAGKMAVIAILLVIVGWVLPYVTALGKVSDYFNSLGVPTLAGLAVVVMCIVTGENGKPIIELGPALAKLNWLLVVFIGGIMFFVGNLGSDTYGIVAALKNLFAPMATNLSPVLVIIMGALLSVVLTQFMSNSVSCTIAASVFVPVLLTTGQVSTGIVIVFSILLSCIANCAYMTYGGAAGVGVVCKDDEITLKEAFPNSLVMVVITFVCAFAGMLPLISRLYN